MEVLRGMGVEVEVKCEICGKGGWGSVAELYEHRREEHKEAKVKRVRRKREPKKRGRKPGWRSRVGKKKKKGEDDSEGEENEGDEGGEVKVKEEVETASEEDEEDYFEEGKEEVMGITEKDGGKGRRSLRRSARGQINYVEDKGEEEEDSEMEFKQSPHTSEDNEDDGDWN